MKRILVIWAMIYGLAAEEQDKTSNPWEKKSVIDQDFLDSVNSFYGIKHPLYPESYNDEVKRIVDTANISMQSRIIKSCTCETQYEIRDLGEGNYPRYLTASRCKPKICQTKFNPCRLLHYRIYILKQRDLSAASDERYSDDNSLPEAPLPESLRHKWQMKPLSIAVACIPGMETERN